MNDELVENIKSAILTHLLGTGEYVVYRENGCATIDGEFDIDALASAVAGIFENDEG